MKSNNHPEKPLWRVLGYTKPYWKTLVFSLVTASLFGAVSTVPTYVLKHTIDDIFIKRYSHLIVPFLLIFIAVFLLKGLFMYLSSYSMQWVNNKVTIDIRNDLFSKIVHFPTCFYQSKSTGHLMSHFLNDIQMIQQAAGAAIRDGVRSFFEACGLLGFAIYQNATLGLSMLVVGPLIGYTIMKLGRARKNASLAIQSQLGHISSMLQETFVGIREIKAFNAESVEQSRFKNLLQRCFGAVMLNVHIEAILPALVEAIAVTGCGVIFYIAAHQVLDGIITAGQLTAFVAAVILAYQPLKKIINVYSEIQYGLAAAERIFTVLDTVYPATQNRTQELSCFTTSIEFKSASFSYNEHSNVFSHVNLSIHKGESIGIIGQSGAGKSTLCDLLLGFITPPRQTVFIDGNDIAEISLASLRSHIGYVGQRAFLFNDSVAHNVAYAHPNATQQEIIAACKMAHAHEFIEMLPNGYETIVGENGTLLSGGQKQRLTIARALLKKPDILIFDEATSALDEESECLIRLAIEEIRGSTTMIIVSHRPTMLHKIDRIFEISHGSIREIERTHQAISPLHQVK
jgi:ATP-binding cassette, subfamily B, bacterial MsbA